MTPREIYENGDWQTFLYESKGIRSEIVRLMEDDLIDAEVTGDGIRLEGWGTVEPHGDCPLRLVVKGVKGIEYALMNRTL